MKISIILNSNGEGYITIKITIKHEGINSYGQTKEVGWEWNYDIGLLVDGLFKKLNYFIRESNDHINRFIVLIYKKDRDSDLDVKILSY